MSEKNDNRTAYDVMAVFSMKYSPATVKTVTDKFTSKEILNLIISHTGKEIFIAEIFELMIQMRYEYEMSDSEFVWLCQKD